jgi:hypothetical protein
VATVLAVKTKILTTIQDTAQDNFVDAEIWQYMNECLAEIGQDLANLGARIALKTDETITLAATGYTVTLPDDFWAPVKIFRSDAGGATFTTNKLSFTDYSDSWEAESAADVGTPSHYYFIGTTMYVHPRADDAYMLKLYYYPKQAITADTDTLPWGGLFDEAIQWYTIAKCYQRDEINQAWQLAEAKYQGFKETGMGAVLQRDDFEIGFDEPYTAGKQLIGLYYT